MVNDQPDVTVVLVNYNGAHLFERLFDALDAAQEGLKCQIIVVDNASRDESVTILHTKYLRAELIENKVNVGFGRANNQALPYARGRYILLLNTDAFVAPDTLRKTIEFMDAHPRCGIVGVKLVGGDGSLQPSCRFFPTPWNIFLASTGLKRFFPGARLVDDMSWDHNSVRECDWVPGCYYLVRREVIDRVGLFDPRYFLYYEEIDHCRAVRGDGWSVVYYPFTRVVHIGGESAASEGPLVPRSRQISSLRTESELLYFRKQYGPLGLLAAVVLALAADLFIAGKSLVLHLKLDRAAAAAKHIWTVFNVLLATRLASRATR